MNLPDKKFRFQAEKMVKKIVFLAVVIRGL
jgi:hypothetical protein